MNSLNNFRDHRLLKYVDNIVIQIFQTNLWDNIIDEIGVGIKHLPF